MKCFYHSADLDGHCSGAIVKRKFPECEMVGIDYGQPFPWDTIVSGETVFMVDFSLQPFEDMERLAGMCKLIWIDHHQTAIDEAHGRGFLAHEQFLEVGRAACELTSCYINVRSSNPSLKPMNRAVYLLGRYDVWDLNADPDVMDFQYGMRMEKDTLPGAPIWNAVLGDSPMGVIRDICKTGKTVSKYQTAQSTKYAKACAFKSEINGLPAIAMNVGMANSQMFESVWDSEKYKVMMPFVWKDGKWTVSLYTTPETGIDVGLIAKAYGGGGHKQAAGFQCAELPFQMSYEEYEWVCDECGNKGDYADIRKPIDSGVDQCPQCSTEVTCRD